MTVHEHLCHLARVLVLALWISSAAIVTAAEDKHSRSAVDVENEARSRSIVWSRQAVEDARRLYSEAAKLWIREKDIRRAAGCYREAAKLAQTLSDYESALASLRAALRLKQGKTESEGAVISMSLFSLVSRQQGNKVEAERYATAAIRAAENVPEYEAKAYALFASGVYTFYYGEVQQALNLF